MPRRACLLESRFARHRTLSCFGLRASFVIRYSSFRDKGVSMSDSRPFVHLHCHTHYSLLDGANRIPELVAKAKQAGMNALAITDHGNLYGALEFYTNAKAVGINPIL